MDDSLFQVFLLFAQFRSNSTQGEADVWRYETIPRLIELLLQLNGRYYYRKKKKLTECKPTPFQVFDTNLAHPLVLWNSSAFGVFGWEANQIDQQNYTILALDGVSYLVTMVNGNLLIPQILQVPIIRRLGLYRQLHAQALRYDPEPEDFFNKQSTN